MNRRLNSRFTVGTGMTVPALLICGAAFLSLAGCVRDNTDDCYYDSRLYIVVESQSGDYGGDVTGASFYLFDDGRSLLSSQWVTGEDIAGNVAIPVSYNRNHLPWAVAWGNYGDGQAPVPPGETMDNMYISMERGDDGYTLPADNLFYGMKRLSGLDVETVAITPKTGMIAITAVGFAQDDTSQEYYFTVDTPYDRYDYAGTPLSGTATLKLDAAFQGTVLRTPQGYRLFHFPEAGGGGESATVSLYMVGGSPDGSDLLLASADRDENGVPITILRERTTNVLLDISAGLEIRVVVTGWDVIYQWDEW